MKSFQLGSYKQYKIMKQMNCGVVEPSIQQRVTMRAIETLVAPKRHLIPSKVADAIKAKKESNNENLLREYMFLRDDYTENDRRVKVFLPEEVKDIEAAILHIFIAERSCLERRNKQKRPRNKAY